MNFESIIIAAATFFIIGIFHPIVIKAEYYCSKKIWPVFLIAGLGFLVGAIFTCGLISILFAITGTSSLRAIKELFEQEKRVNKGWFPKNSSRKWLLTAHCFKYGGFDKLNHRNANLLDSPFLLLETDTIRCDGRRRPVCSLCGACVHFQRHGCRWICKNAAHCWLFCRTFTPVRIVCLQNICWFKIKKTYRNSISFSFLETDTIRTCDPHLRRVVL